MADAKTTAATPPAPRKRRRWLRAIVWVFSILIVLLVVVYFVGTSSAVFKGVILPKVSAALNARVTVSDASISPFSQVVLHNVKVETTGTEPLATVAEVRLRYSLMDIIRGNIRVDEVSVSSPVINLVKNPDGTSNLDPITKSQKSKPAPAQPAQPSKPPKLDLKKIALTDATVRQVTLYTNGNRDSMEISRLNLSVENVQNGQTGKLTTGADINMKNNPPSGTNSSLQAKLQGEFTFALTADLKPGSIQGNTRFEVTQAEGALADVAALKGMLDCNITPTEIKQVALQFQKGGMPLGKVLVAGPFNMEKTEGRITVQVLDIDRNLLNLAGASSGLNFGPTRISSTNQIELVKTGQAMNAMGQFNLNQFQVTRANQTTPPLDLHADYNVSVDSSASNAVLRGFTLTATQKGRQLVQGELAKPMTFSWGNAANAVGDSSLTLTVSHLDLADWKPFIGDSASSGDVNGKLQLLSQQGGKQLSFDVTSQIDNLTARAGSNQISQATVTLQLRGQAADLKQFNFPEYKLQIARQNQPLVTASGSGTYDMATEKADVQLAGQVLFPALIQAMPQPDMNISSGTAELKMHVVQSKSAANEKAQAVTGSMALRDFTGTVGSNSFRSFNASADLDVKATPQQVQIQKVSGKLSEGQNPGGNFELSGVYGISNHAAQLTAKADFNQNGLRPFLESALGDKKLTSVALNANASVQYDPQAASAVKADMQMTNLVVNDPKGQFPTTPLEMKMGLDVAMNKDVTDVRQCQLSLTPTVRATNQVQLTAHIDRSQTNAMQGNLKVAADSLDFTTYYDLFGGQNKPAAAQPAPSTSQPSTAPSKPAGPEQEPPPRELPFRNFTAEVAIGRLFLHEIAITNVQVVSKLDSTKIALDPCKLAINGAPVSSTINLDTSVPGYKYAFVFSANAVPLAPIVNSFQPERKGILSGTMTAQANINGAGVTGASLQKTLAGQLDIGSTNLNLSVDSIQGKSASTRLLKFLLDTIAMIPELAQNPSAGASSLISSLASSHGAASSGGLSGDMKKSPINSIILHGKAGSGQVDLQQALVQSPAFLTQVTGSIKLAPVLTNSTINLPVSIWLEQGVAQRLKLNGAAEGGYTKLPDFLTMVGTIGNPQRSYNRAALISTVAGSVLQGLGGKNSQIGSALQGLGGVLGGNKSAPPPNQPGTQSSGSNTNKPATNQSPVGNILNQLLGPKK
jgi:uncharacterized protein involved in outer membrane biogenesis